MWQKLKPFVDQATAQQDYAWFCVILLWLLVAGLLYARRRELRALPFLAPWVVGLLAGGLALALGEMIMHALPPDDFQAERVGWDRWLAGAALVQLLALLAPLWSEPGRRRRALLAFAVLLLGSLWLLRRDHPFVANGGLAFAGFSLGLAGVFSLRRFPSLGSRWVLPAACLAVGVAYLLGTTGLVADLSSQQRRWTLLSLLGLPSAFSQFLLAGLLLAGLNPRAWLASFSPGELPPTVRQGLRLLCVGAVAWILVGFGVSWWTGKAARRAFEESLIARARTSAALVDPEHVLPVVGPGFHLEQNTEMTQGSGRRNSLAFASYLKGVYKPTADDLAKVDAANPGIQWAHLLTFRDGYVVSCVFSSQLKLRRDVVALHRTITAADRAAWSAHLAYFEGPAIGGWGENIRALAPIVHPRAGMLGWVALDFGASDWTAAQALARLQTFALIGAGAAILLLLLVQNLLGLQQEQSRRLAADAQSADRAKTAFLAKVSHELRTPVQSILGFGEMLAHLPLEEKPARWLGAIRSQGQLLIRLVNDLLDLSAIQSGAFKLAPRPVDLAQLVRSCVDSLRPRTASRLLDLHCHTDPAIPPWLLLDPERVRQILFNLLGNAIKFTDAGAIHVQLTLVAAGASPAAPTAQVLLSVRDTGSGIPLEAQAALFRPFSRLREHADREGTGLGLALTAALASSMQGAVRVVSDGRTGSEFLVELCFPASTAAGVTAPTRTQPISLAGWRVLVADDNALVRELYQTGLETAGAWCETASDGLEAVERCTTEPFDVVVLDVSMPWLDGMESARRIRAQARPGLRIVGVSAHAGVSEREMGVAAGMDAFLVKPVALTDLLAAVAGQDPGATAPQASTGIDEPLLNRLREQFGREVPRLLGELAAAADAGDRHWLRARAHHLKNSADVAGYHEISLLCSRLESLVTAQAGGQGPALVGVVNDIRICWRRLKPDSAPPLPDSPGEKPTS